jgi:hypothetical protein
VQDGVERVVGVAAQVILLTVSLVGLVVAALVLVPLVA